MEIIANEQSPKDNFQAAMYNGTYWNDANCPGGVVAGDRGGVGNYCLLMVRGGEARLGSVEPQRDSPSHAVVVQV